MPINIAVADVLGMDPSLTDEELIDLFEFRRSPIMRFYEYLGTTGAEWNYAVGVPLNYAAAFSQTIPPTAGLGIALGWNYLDAIYAIGLGTLQLLDEEDYRQTQNKVKGVLNIISGVQMFLLSYNPAFTAAMGLAGGAALAAPSFALAMACDLVSASIDFYNAHKEVKFEGWLEERAKEMAYDRARILKFDKKIEELKKLNSIEGQPELYYLLAKKRKLEEKIKNNEENVYARSRVYCQGDTDKFWKVKKILYEYDPERDDSQVDARRKGLEKSVTQEDRNKDEKIQKQLTETYKQNRINLAIKTASFIGMTLLAVSSFVSCPPLLIVGLAITAVVAGVYIYRNSEQIVKKIDGVVSGLGLFSSQKDQAIEKHILDAGPSNNITRPSNSK